MLSRAPTTTGIYAPHQVLTAIACGADYAAPYLGRMNDAGQKVRAPAACLR